MLVCAIHRYQRPTCRLCLFVRLWRDTLRRDFMSHPDMRKTVRSLRVADISATAVLVLHPCAIAQDSEAKSPANTQRAIRERTCIACRSSWQWRCWATGCQSLLTPHLVSRPSLHNAGYLSPSRDPLLGNSCTPQTFSSRRYATSEKQFSHCVSNHKPISKTRCFVMLCDVLCFVTCMLTMT